MGPQAMLRRLGRRFEALGRGNDNMASGSLQQSRPFRLLRQTVALDLVGKTPTGAARRRSVTDGRQAALIVRSDSFIHLTLFVSPTSCT
jgi:hypothetical protein